MALLGEQEELDRAAARVPFARAADFEAWATIWCKECAFQEYCPLLSVMLHEKTPAQWVDRDVEAVNRYTCTEFEQQKDLDETQDLHLSASA